MRIFFLALVFFALVSKSHNSFAPDGNVENMELEFASTTLVRNEPKPRTQSNPWAKLSGRDMLERGRAPIIANNRPTNGESSPEPRSDLDFSAMQTKRDMFGRQRARGVSRGRKHSSSASSSSSRDDEPRIWEETSGFNLASEFYF